MVQTFLNSDLTKLYSMLIYIYKNPRTVNRILCKNKQRKIPLMSNKEGLHENQ